MVDCLAALDLRNVCSLPQVDLAPNKGLRQDHVGHRRPLPCCSTQLSSPSTQQALLRTDIFQPSGAISRLAGTGLTLAMHAWIPWSCFLLPYWADRGSQYRISGAIRFRLFPALWVPSYIAGQSALPQCHRITDYVSSSAAPRLAITFNHSRTERCSPSSASLVPHSIPGWRRLTRQPRGREENVFARKRRSNFPSPTNIPRFAPGFSTAYPLLDSC